MKLEILICTINEGINRVKEVLMPESKEISYLVSWQQTDEFSGAETPAELIRNDVKVCKLEGRGLSRNRNNALRNATGDVCLIADDDVKYDKQKVDFVLATFEEHPTLDVATFKYESKRHPKHYPSFSFDLRHAPRHYYVSSIEIAFRRSSVQGVIEFNELFGIGAPVLGAGEEEIFIVDALNQGLNCMFFPKVVVVHESPTTTIMGGARQEVIMARGAVIRVYHSKSYFLRYVVTARRIKKKSKVGFFYAFTNLLKGGRYAKRQNILKYDIDWILM